MSAIPWHLYLPCKTCGVGVREQCLSMRGCPPGWHPNPKNRFIRRLARPHSGRSRVGTGSATIEHDASSTNKGS